MLIYSAIQVEQIQDAIHATELTSSEPLNYDPWPRIPPILSSPLSSLPGVKPFLVAVPCVIGFAAIILLFLTWELYHEFGWSIYKHIGASVQMRRNFLIYQIFVALLKFDFFFCFPSSSEVLADNIVLGYEIQSLVIIISITDAEFWITIAALPITIIILVFCAWSVRHEIIVGMVVAIVLFVGGLAYFLFKAFSSSDAF